MRFAFHPRLLSQPKLVPFSRCALGGLALLFFALALAAWPRSAVAQAAWEFSPYDVKVCLALDNAPEFTPAFASLAREELANRADIVFFATW